VKARLLAWLALLLLVWACWVGATNWKNPWSPGGLLSFGSPVLANLPALPDGCKEKGCP